MNKLINVELNEGTGRAVVDKELVESVIDDILKGNLFDEDNKFFMKYYMRAAIRRYLTKLFKTQ